MFKEVQEVRYTNEAQDTLYILFNDDDGNTQEMYIENGGADHKALMELGVTDEQIIEQTAEWKKSAARDIANIAKKAAYDVYGEEVERLKADAMKAKSATLMANQDVLRIQAKARMLQERNEEMRLQALQSKVIAEKELQDKKQEALATHALDQKLQTDSTDKIRAVNKYVAEQLGNEKLEVAVANLKAAVKALNDNEDAIKIAGNGKNYKTLLGALKATI